MDVVIVYRHLEIARDGARSVLPTGVASHDDPDAELLQRISAAASQLTPER
jgi:hypothetical protein